MTWSYASRFLSAFPALAAAAVVDGQGVVRVVGDVDALLGVGDALAREVVDLLGLAQDRGDGVGLHHALALADRDRAALEIEVDAGDALAVLDLGALLGLCACEAGAGQSKR
jgi:hypothetical protein